MSGKISTETKICNLLHDYLFSEGYQIIQLVPPSGQAIFSITYFSLNFKRKTIFPDLIAVRRGEILIGEAKSDFSESDMHKLLEIERSVVCREKIQRLISRVLKIESSTFEVQCILIHGNKSSPNNQLIRQLILTSDEGFFWKEAGDSRKENRTVQRNDAF